MCTIHPAHHGHALLTADRIFPVFQNSLELLAPPNRGVDFPERVGVVPQRPNLDFSLTAREILTFHGAYFGLSSKARNERANSLLEKFKLTDRAAQMVSRENLSCRAA